MNALKSGLDLGFKASQREFFYIYIYNKKGPQ